MILGKIKNFQNIKILMLPNVLLINKNKKNKNNTYSNYLRHSICHGYPSINNLTTNKMSYNDLVSKEHLSDASNIESPFRRKKDWLGVWTEQSLVSKQVWKNLDKNIAEKAKAKSAISEAKSAKS